MKRNNVDCKDEKGVTLIALVLTVIIMGILTGIIVASALDEDFGIIPRAQDSLDEKTSEQNQMNDIQTQVIQDLKDRR